ncbi:electron transport complex protein RnfG [Lachnospiraceae bacterium KM106-2]|nr:electron transport complex protein RnfG [Lachnospiraceae bacterium KM106-2]
MENNKQKSTILKDAIALFLITLVAGLALGFVNEATKGPIQERKDKAKAEAYGAVFTTADSFTDKDEKYTDVEETSVDILAKAGITGVKINEVLDANKGSEKEGYVMSVTCSEAFDGDIKISVGIAADGTVQGMEVLESTETAGLGQKASEPEFKDQFKGKKADSLEVTKDSPSDTQIQAISGATITSKAVTKAVNAAIYYAANCTSN